MYLPYENNENEELYLDFLGKLQAISQSADAEFIYVVGDFNSDLPNTNNSVSQFGSHLLKFANEGKYRISDYKLLPRNSFTYISNVWNTTSWLDHCVCTQAEHAQIKNISVLHSFMSSDHKPLLIDLELDQVVATNDYLKTKSRHINWNKLLNDIICSYKTETNLQ